MSEDPEDVEGCCKGFLSSILAIASFKIETTLFTFHDILFWSREVLDYRRPSDTVVDEMKNTTTQQSNHKNTTTNLTYDAGYLRRNEDWTTT